jgi:signal peptidase I
MPRRQDRHSGWMHFGALGGLIAGLLERFETKGRQRRRAIKESKLLLREARRALRKYSHRITDKARAAVRAASEELSSAVAERDDERIKPALNALDKALDDHLSFARKGPLREYSESIAVAVLIALFLRAFVVEAFKIPSGSMIPTLQVGDHIFVNKFIYGVQVPFSQSLFGHVKKFWMDYHKPRRGEVIVFIYPVDKDKDFIKRIVAIEGDTVEVKNNILYVNGKAVEHHKIDDDCHYRDFDEVRGEWFDGTCDRYNETLDGNTYTTYFDRDAAPRSWSLRRVPPGNVFVMGDNRDHSSDSRYWGTVPLENIKGKAMVIWWSQGEANDDPGTVRGVRVDRMFHLVK